MRDVDSTEKRISLLRSLMIFGVVILHTPPYVPIANIGSGPFDLIVAFFQHAVFRTTVPVLTFISGYLLFRSSLDTQPVRLLQKKFNSIVIPFLFFNLTLVVLYVLLQNGAGVRVGSATFETTEDWINAAFGLTASPLNYPLNFLRDLIALFMLAPLMGWLLRNAAWPGFALVLVIFQFDLDGPFLLRNAMAPVFYAGGMAAILKWNMQRLDRYALELLAVFLFACGCIVYFKVANTSYLQLVAPILIWPAASLLAPTALGTRLAKMSKYSYFLFLAHAPVLLFISMIYKRFSQTIPFPLYWVMTPVLVTGIVIGVYQLFMRIKPAAFNMLIGNSHRLARSAKAMFSDRRRTPRPASDRRAVPRPVGAPIYSPELRMTLPLR
jgi:succinoglycan biosynthesis protein ExoH